MGRLKPGATYVYENADGVIYAREFGAAPHTRFEIGRELAPRVELIEQDQLWRQIRQEAKANPALQEALDRAIIIYKLSQSDDR